jgi:hypothetical protein
MDPREVAKDLLRIGADVNTIVMRTGLSGFEIAELNKELMGENINIPSLSGSSPVFSEVTNLLNADSTEDATVALAAGTGDPEAYTSIKDLVDSTGIRGIEEFVREVYAPEDEQNIPESVLPATVFGALLMNEPGDWKQAVLRARGKAAVIRTQSDVKEKTDKAKLNLDIRKKALEIYNKNQPKAVDLTELIGKVTPDSLQKFSETRNFGDLKTLDEEKDFNNLLDKFTVSSVATYQETGDFNDLVRLPKTSANTLDTLFKYFTPESIEKYTAGGSIDESLLITKPDKLNNTDIKDFMELMDDYTAPSIDLFMESGKFSDLIPKADGGLITTAGVFGDDSEGTRAENINNMLKKEYIAKLLPLDDTRKIEQLRTYSTLYNLTTTTKQDKSPTGDTLKDQVPLVNTTPQEYAKLLGLDTNLPEVAGLIELHEFQLPIAPSADREEYLALLSLQDKMNAVGLILTNAPKNVTGVKKEVLNSQTARIFSDLTGYKIPSEVTLLKVLQNVAEIDLIEAIIKEDRFTEQDRKMVREFIKGSSFTTIEEARLRHKEVIQLLNRKVGVLENTLEGYRKFDIPGTVERQQKSKARIDELMQLLQNN